MVINFDIVCITGTVRGQAKKNNVSIPWKTGKSTIVTHGTIRVNVGMTLALLCSISVALMVTLILKLTTKNNADRAVNLPETEMLRLIGHKFRF